MNRLVAKKIPASTIRNTVNPVRAVYRQAVQDGVVAVNPAHGLQMPAVDSGRERTASPAEAEELLAALPERDQALWATAFYAGLRRGELRALRWRHVDLTGKPPRIRVESGWDDYQGEIDPKSKKGARLVPIPARLVKTLAAHKMATGRGADDFCFGATAGSPFTPSNIRKRANREWAVANEKRAESKQPLLVPIGLHEARHTYVSLMHAAGVSLEEIGDYVGHSSAYMTDKYRHLLPGSDVEAIKKLDALLG